MANIQNISDSKLAELLGLLHQACQIVGTCDTFRENMADLDYLTLMLTKLRVIDELTSRIKPIL